MKGKKEWWSKKLEKPAPLNPQQRSYLMNLDKRKYSESFSTGSLCVKRNGVYRQEDSYWGY